MILNSKFLTVLILILISCQISVQYAYSRKNSDFRSNVKTSLYVKLKKFLKENGYKEIPQDLRPKMPAMRSKIKSTTPIMTKTSRIDFFSII